jgi:hypothetical protein
VPVHRSARDRVPHDHQRGHRGIAGGALQPDQPMLTRGARSNAAPNAAGRSAALAVLVLVGCHWLQRALWYTVDPDGIAAGP